MPANYARSLCDFIDASPSAFHAVEASAAMLKAAGAVALDERQRWKLEAGRSYYIVRGGAALIALRIGGKAPSEAGFAVAGAHTDSPALRIRFEKAVQARGIERAAVEAYGGPIHSTWLDRPLTMAGRALVRGKDGKPPERLVDLKKPVAIIPNLAIHFNREMNKGVEYPMNSALMPIVACRKDGDGLEGSWALRAAAEALAVEASDILSADLSFVDASPSVVWGPDGEFISAPRIDKIGRASCRERV